MKQSDKSDFIDFIYHYKGQWDVSSQCGIKIITKKDVTIIIATELYDTNTGTSVTKWNTHIATLLCAEHNIAPERLVFIEHTPDRGSKLDFYNEAFFKVELEWNGTKFVKPVWNQVSPKEVEDMVTN